jgi:GNAT superfamily N-acetyltransferase
MALERKSLDIKGISSENRQQINDFIKSQWFSTDMAVKGELVDMTNIDGFAAYEYGEIIGLVTYRIIDSECEIMSLDSLREKKGIGTAIVNKVIEKGAIERCDKVTLITTNDNINALRFYQKRGFDMVKVYRNSVKASRKLKPSIPMIGEFGIPIKHEIEFEMELT